MGKTKTYMGRSGPCPPLSSRSTPFPPRWCWLPSVIIIEFLSCRSFQLSTRSFHATLPYPYTPKSLVGSMDRDCTECTEIQSQKNTTNPTWTTTNTKYQIPIPIPILKLLLLLLKVHDIHSAKKKISQMTMKPLQFANLSLYRFLQMCELVVQEWLQLQQQQNCDLWSMGDWVMMMMMIPDCVSSKIGWTRLLPPLGIIPLCSGEPNGNSPLTCSSKFMDLRKIDDPRTHRKIEDYFAPRIRTPSDLNFYSTGDWRLLHTHSNRFFFVPQMIAESCYTPIETGSFVPCKNCFSF